MLLKQFGSLAQLSSLWVLDSQLHQLHGILINWTNTEKKLTKRNIRFSKVKPFTAESRPDLVTVNIVNIPGLVKELLLTILLLLLSKITVDLVKNLDLVKFFLLTKNFTKSGLYCNDKIDNTTNGFFKRFSSRVKGFQWITHSVHSGAF